tara:strand:+ start:123 stop:965 length:843 start_codon:yes stop_codon:yes gene_type:complete
MIRSYCKINLSLRVIKKLKSGLHNIQSNIFILNLFDEIEISKLKKKSDLVIFKGQFKKHINPKKNSITETLRLLRQKKLIKVNQFYKVTVLKKIPVFAGFGGGTSNSYFVTKYFLKNKINNKKIIKELEKKIGSDLRVFKHQQMYQISLRQFNKFKKKLNFYFVLVYPNLRCSTKMIYARVKNLSKFQKDVTSNVKSKNNFIDIIKEDKNDLEKISILKYPKIRKVLSSLSMQNKCILSRMTGSGSACFGMFSTKKSALLALRKIKNKFPGYWCVTAKSI